MEKEIENLRFACGSRTGELRRVDIWLSNKIFDSPYRSAKYLRRSACSNLAQMPKPH